MGNGGNGTGKSHPAGNDVKLGREIIGIYNTYVKTGDMSGARPTAYLALVPFERGTSDKSVLDPLSTQGPDENANVMCLTCHRAHASAFQSVGRWDFRATFIARSHPQAGDAGAAGNDEMDSYYGRDVDAQFGSYQRSLCNKCHLKD
ncbi:MAG: cytochrome C, partial [Deltaproteobacteria bacterium]|nr:cytochrome C [Deltaproteobacteria bacterium]